MAELLGTINNSTDLEGVLGTFTEAIDEHVEPFVKQLGEDVVLGSYRPMFMTPESPNSARTMVPVLYKGVQVATLYVIAFLPGDCTGDETHGHTVDEITKISKQFGEEFILNSDYVPRDKDGTGFEAWLPLFSVKDGKIQSHHNYMSGISVEKTADGGMELVLDYDMVCAGEPHMSMTVGPDPLSGLRIGDPHAIYFDPKHAEDYDVQVVGFLGVKDDNQLYDILRQKTDMHIQNR